MKDLVALDLEQPEIAAGSPAQVRRALSRVRAAVWSLGMPAPLLEALRGAAAGPLAAADADPGAGLWESIKRVWASKWTERAYLSRRACGVDDGDLYMAVLLMDMVPADYAFVLHSVNPTTGDADEVVGQVVVGLGEVLVGNEPGCALSFSAPKAGGRPEILSLPSKLRAQFVAEGGAVIARSDSNGEDLEAFAGAGLYESHPARGNDTRVVDYAAERLFTDEAFAESIARRLGAVAVAVEAATGAAQDIEGAIRIGPDGEPTVYLVQSRAQVV